MQRKRILVTGGAGFIGGNLVHYMTNKYPYYDIYMLDILTYAGDVTKHQQLQTKDNYHFIKMDITDRAALFSIFEQFAFDYVIHCAAESHVDRSIANPEIFVRTNVLGTQVLLDAAKTFGVAKFVHISTDEVYGELEFDMATCFTEGSPLKPNSPYSASKAAADFIVRSYTETFALPTNIMRSSNNYGPYQMPEKLIPLTISHALKNKKVPVYGEGKHIRDWIHVHDHCTAIDVVLHEGVCGEIYNVGARQERMNIDIVRTVLGMLEKSEDLIEFVKDRLGHDKRYAIDPNKLEQLGWNPLFDFEIGVEQTVNWYVKNREWWERML